MPQEFNQRYDEKHEGFEVEKNVLGQVRPEVRFYGEEIIERGEDIYKEYLPFEQAIDLVRDNQEFEDPSDPHEKPFPDNLHSTIVELLDLKNHQQLQYFTAIRSKVDWFHQTDAFVEMLSSNGELLRAILDLTTSKNALQVKLEEKESKHKRWYIAFLWEKKLWDGDLSKKSPEYQKLFEDTVNQVAQEVTRTLKTQAQERGLTVSSLSLDEIQRSKELSAEEREKRVSFRLPRRLKRRRAYAY